jgi:hypothetical protein
MLLLASGEALAGQVTLAWDPSEDAVAGYMVYYGTVSGEYSGQVDVASETSWTLFELTPGVRYYFVVKAYSSSGVFSAASNEVTAVVDFARPFTDDPLLPGVHIMKAVHITELRDRIDALRVARGVSPWEWALLGPGTFVRASHLTELRAALNEVFVARGLPTPPYLDSALTAGTPIKALHITQLRSAVAVLE